MLITRKLKFLQVSPSSDARVLAAPACGGQRVAAAGFRCICFEKLRIITTGRLGAAVRLSAGLVQDVHWRGARICTIPSAGFLSISKHGDRARADQVCHFGCQLTAEGSSSQLDSSRSVVGGMVGWWAGWQMRGILEVLDAKPHPEPCSKASVSLSSFRQSAASNYT